MRIEGKGATVDYEIPRNEMLKVDDNATSRKAQNKDGEANAKLGIEALKIDSKVSADQLQEAVDTVNKAMDISTYHLEFKLHKESGRYQVKMVDNDTAEVIRVIPTQDVLEFSAKVKKMLDKMIGLLVDKLA
jgi:flagellar protein FlaG